MDETSVTPKDIILGVLLILLMLAAFTFASTVDYQEDLRHEQWMIEREERGEWVIR